MASQVCALVQRCALLEDGGVHDEVDSVFHSLTLLGKESLVNRD
jgi:hypothetical protein